MGGERELRSFPFWQSAVLVSCYRFGRLLQEAKPSGFRPHTASELFDDNNDFIVCGFGTKAPKLMDPHL